MAIRTWFPTAIYQESLTNELPEHFNADLLSECYKIKEIDEEGQIWSQERYVGGYTSFGSLSELHTMSSTFEDLARVINTHVSQYATYLEFDLGAGELRMSECWVNIMPTQTSHSMHIHPLSVISGTYYVHTPKNAASIKFEDPRIDKFMAAPPKAAKPHPRNRQVVEYKAKAGNMVLFESWLRHEVPASITNEDRVSISFNYDWV